MSLTNRREDFKKTDRLFLVVPSDSIRSNGHKLGWEHKGCPRCSEHQAKLLYYVGDQTLACPYRL